MSTLEQEAWHDHCVLGVQRLPQLVDQVLGQVRQLPVTAQDVTAMVGDLKLNKLLAGFRGKPAADRAALEATVLALAKFYLDHRARIEDVEINPLMVRPNGAVAVDVRVIWKS